MSAGWIDALAVVATIDAPLFVSLLERHVSGADVTYWSEEHLCVEPETEDDEALLRLALPDRDAIGGTRQAGERSHLLPLHLSEEVHRWLADGLFEGTAAALTVVGLELRDGSVLRRLGAALDGASTSFVGQPPQLWRA